MLADICKSDETEGGRGASERTQFVMLACAADPQECLAPGRSFGHFTDRNLPAPESIHAVLGGSRPAIYCTATRESAGYVADK